MLLRMTTLRKWLNRDDVKAGEAAKLLDITPSAISFLRNGLRRPGPELLARCIDVIPDFDAAGTILEYRDADHRRTSSAGAVPEVSDPAQSQPTGEA